MLTIVHLTTGAAIGIAIREPILVIPIAIASHYLLDSIPHYAPEAIHSFKDNGFKSFPFKEVFVKSLEPLVGIAIVLSMFVVSSSSLKTSVALGAFFAWFPDLLAFIYWKFEPQLPKPVKFIETTIHQNKLHRHISILDGLPLQIMITAAAVIYVFIKI